MGEISLIGVTVVLCEKGNSIWKNIDDSLCRLEILKSEKDSKYRLVGISADNRCILNKWVRTNSVITKCSDVFLEIKQVSTQTSTADYIGINFAYKEEVTSFFNCFSKCIESLKDQRETYRNSMASANPVGGQNGLSNYSISISTSMSFDSNLNLLAGGPGHDLLPPPPPPTNSSNGDTDILHINQLPPPPTSLMSSININTNTNTTNNNNNTIMPPPPNSTQTTPILTSNHSHNTYRPTGLLRTTSIPTNLNTEVTPSSLADIFNNPNPLGNSGNNSVLRQQQVITTTTTTINYASRNKTANGDSGSFLKTARNVNKIRNSIDARKTLSKKDASNFAISLQNVEGLQNIAEALEEETLNLLDLVNEQVTNPTSSQVFLNQSITKVYEHLQILFILTGDSGQTHNGGPIIKSITSRLTKGPQESEFSGNTIGSQVMWFNVDEIQSSVTGFHNLMHVQKNLIPTIAHLSTSVRVLGLQASLEVDWMSRNMSSEPEKVVVQLAYLSRELITSMSRLMAATLTFCRVNTSIQQLKSDPSFNLVNRVRSPSTAELINIWDELKQIKTPPSVPKEGVTKATLNQLILMITSESSYDVKFLKTFITTYQSFATPGLLLSKLLERFQVPEWYSTVKSKILTIQQRVIVVLKYWVENQSSDFDQDVIDQIYYFINNTLAASEGYQDLSKSLSNLLDKVIQEREIKTELLFQMPARLQFEEDGVISPIELFSEWSPQLIAHQLCLIDFSIFKEIEARELMSQNFNKQKYKWRSPTVMRMINRSTQFSFWVASVILMEGKKEKRIKNFEKFCDVGKYLLKYNNLNSLMSLIAGLNLTPVHRLKKTKKKLSGTASQFLSDCEKLFSSKKSFKVYRDHLASVQLPCIPYLGLILTDLTFIDEGNQDTVEGSNSNLGPLVNFKKRELFYQAWTDLNNFKTTPYSYQPEEPLHTFLLHFPILEEKELYDLSLLIEPR